MVDVFGSTASFTGQRGPRGAVGPRGLPGSMDDVCEWMPQSVVKNLQKYDELGCYFIDSVSADLKKAGSNVTEWISRCNDGDNLIVKKNVKAVEKVVNRYALNFEAARLVIEDVNLIGNTPSTSGFICVTFKSSSETDQVLLTNYNADHKVDYHEISITNSDIIITILDHKEIIQHQTKRWTTLFISYASDTHTTHYKYSVNGISGEFTSSINVNPISGITIGSRYDDTRFFVGQLSCLEVYTRAVPTLLPNAMQRLVIANQEMV